MRTLVFILALLSTMDLAGAEPTGRWVITFHDSDDKELLHCNFSPARLWVGKQSVVIYFDTNREPWLTKVTMSLKESPVVDLRFDLESGDNIIMTGSFRGGSASGTWASPTLSCRGDWTARATIGLPPPRLVEIKLKTTSGPCPEDMPTARIWFQAQSPLAIDDTAGQPKPYRRAEALSLFTHLWEYLLETGDGEYLHVWRSGGFGPERSEWTSLARDCKGTWTMTQISQ